MIHFRVRYERLRDRLRALRRRATLLRATWLALVVPLAAACLRLVTGIAVAWWLWCLLTGLVFALAAVGAARAAATGEPSRWLDRRFALQDLLVTAVEVDRHGPRSAIEVRLLDDAATAVAQFGATPALGGHAARREAETVAAVVLLVSGVWLLAATLRVLPAQERLPVLSLSASGLGGGAGNGAGDAALPGGGSGAGTLGGASSEMRAIAAALGDRAAARGVARALDQGDPRAAARAARSLGERADQLSATGRRDLADALHGAAEAASATDPALAEALRRAARALEAPGASDARPAVEQLAAALDTLATRGNVPDAGARRPQTRSHAGPPAPRLAVTAEPAALPTVSRAPAGGSGASDAPVGAGAPTAPSGPVVGGDPSAAGAAPGADPLSYPWAQREAIRRYFARGTGAP